MSSAGMKGSIMREDFHGLVWCNFAEEWAGMRRPAGELGWYCEFCGEDHSPAACKFCGDSVGAHVCDGSLIV